MKLVTGLTIIIVFFSCYSAFSQQIIAYSKSNASRLYIDFEVQGISNPDTMILNAINLDEYEHNRKTDKRAIVYEASSGYTLILYSQKEADINRAKQHPLQRVPLNREKQIKSNY